MNIIEDIREEAAVLHIEGRLDSNTSPEFEKKVADMIGAGLHKLVFDFEALSYISSAGLRIVLKTAKDLKRLEGRLVLCAMQDYVREVFEISGFDSFLPITPSLSDALDDV